MTMRKNEKGALTPFHNAEELLKFFPELSKFAEIDFIQIVNIDSTNMEPKIWTKIAKTVIDNENKYDGFVITHGTDTMAYTASALSYALINVGKPIVMTGSQKPLEDIPSDAGTNLINSVSLVSKLPKGVFIVFGQKILQGNRTTKIYESSLDPFDSPIVEPVGTIQLEPEIKNKYVLNNKKIPVNLDFDPNIISFKTIPGLSNNSLMEFVPDCFHGIILEGYGPGNIPNSLMPFLQKAKKLDLPVIILSQCKSGVTKMHLYEVGQQALWGGAIPGGDMTIEAASTKLMWILAQTRDIKKIKKLFLTNIAGEMTVTNDK